MTSAIDIAMRYLRDILGLGLIAAVLLGVANVVARYVFSAALLWADEAAVFFMVVMAYLGALVCTWQRTEIRMTIVTDMLPRRWQGPVAFVQNVLLAGVIGWAAVLSYGYVARLFNFGMTSDALGLPMWALHGAVTVSFAAIALIYGGRGLGGLTGRYKPSDDKASVGAVTE